MEGGLESLLQSSPAEGLTVTEAEAGRRGERAVEEGREMLRAGRCEGFGGVPVVWCLSGVRVVERGWKGFARVLGEEEGVKKAATEVTAFLCVS